MVLFLSLQPWLPYLFGSGFNVGVFCDEAARPKEEEMSRIDAYLRAIENGKVKEYHNAHQYQRDWNRKKRMKK